MLEGRQVFTFMSVHCKLPNIWTDLISTIVLGSTYQILYHCCQVISFGRVPYINYAYNFLTVSFFYSETTSTGATRGLSANQKLILKQKMFGSRKNPYPPHGRSLEIPRGDGGILKAKFLEEIYKNKLEFLGGRGV